MKKSKFSEEQIIRILGKAEAGAKGGETCRRYREETRTLQFDRSNRAHEGGMIFKSAIAAMALLLACTGPAQAASAVGEPPPDWLGKTPKGEEIRISERRGKVVLVSFWASWCGFCRQQLPVLEALQQAAGHERMEVVVVNFKEPPRTYRDLVRKLRGLTVTLTHDRDGAISEAYGVTAVPRLFMVDKAGRLGWTYDGHSEAAIPKIEAAANRLLAEPWSPEEDATPVAAAATVAD
jgi:thiol-disulfide isomerase/thioredoxin